MTLDHVVRRKMPVRTRNVFDRADRHQSQFGPLQDNGGNTPTIMPGVGSSRSTLDSTARAWARR